MVRTDIVKLVSSYVPLKKKGATYWGCCPFHHEKTPSFTVNESKQLYHCFGCGEGGNAITFVKKIESVDGAEAVKILAKAAGMEMPQTLFKKDDSGEIAKKRERLYGLMRAAAKIYHLNLSDPRADIANKYLEKRQIDKRLIVKFGLGYSLSGTDVIEKLKLQGYTEAEMKEAGIAENRAGRYYDVYYERLMFPIINNYKEVVAFGGRTLNPDASFAKYRNTSQTVLFDKSRNIYAINLLKDKKQRDGLDCIIIAEGYMDVIALHKAGFDCAVASMGTALTFNQAKQLKNYCDKIYISYDGDTAGQKATLRGLDILASAGLNVKVISLPDGLDPDDIIKTKGKEFYGQLIEEAKTLTDFKISTLKNQYNLQLMEEKAKFTVEAVKIIKALENPVEREEYLKIIQAYTGYSMAALQSQADISVIESPYETKLNTTEKLDAEAIDKKAEKNDKAKLFILASIAADAAYIDYAEDFEPLFEDEFSKYLISYFIDCKQKNKKNPSVLYSMVEEEFSDRLGKILNYEFLPGDNKEKYDNCINVLKIANLMEEKKEIIRIYGEEKDLKLLLRLKEIDNLLKIVKHGGESND